MIISTPYLPPNATLNMPPQLHAFLSFSFFVDKSLSPVSATHMCMGVQPSAGT